jgi:glucose/arabinose dehydrogenase/PKD repeat protein
MRVCAVITVLAALCTSAPAQGSRHGVRLHGAPSRDHDRVRIVVDDDVPGRGSTAADVGAGSFTVELWVRSRPCCNQTPGNAPGSVQNDASWRQGSILLDRWLGSASAQGYGLSVAGARLHAGLGAGPANTPITLAGVTVLTDNEWHHVAMVRDVQNARLSLIVDGVLDAVATIPGTQRDLSYPDAGGLLALVPAANELFVGGSRDEGPSAPFAWRGWLDELRIFDVARRPTEVLADMKRAVPPQTAGLVGSWRMEEGAGQALLQATSTNAPAGVLKNGASGDGEWTDWSVDNSSCAPLKDTALPVGFTKTSIVPPQVEPTALAPLGDGRVLLTLRNGTVLVLRNGSLLSQPAGVLPVAGQSGERGLLDALADPLLPNDAVYVFRTTPQLKDRVSHFTLAGDQIDLSSEVVIWESRGTAPLIHHGGALAFLPDGTLLISTGDGAVAALSRDLSSDQGKLLRLRMDGSVPVDNPFVQTPGALPEIWARGLRNPFRMTTDTQTGRVWVGDVGGNLASSWEEINLAVAGADYGWPEQEGPQCGALPCASVQLPTAAWRHDDPLYNAGSVGGCVIVGTMYRGTRFPAPWRDSLFYADCASRWIRALHFDATGAVAGESLFEPEPAAGSVVDLCTAFDGSLYVATYGVGASGQYEAARVWRYDYAAPSSNTPPVPQFATSVLSGPSPLNVSFNATASYDPDNPQEVLEYLWDFGDGTTGNGATLTHTYTLEGPRTARLRVRDSQGALASSEVQIIVGTPPIVSITQPTTGALFRAGETIAWQATASDAQDGVLVPAALRSTVVVLHNEHEHPFLGPLLGGSGSFVVPNSGHTPEGVRYAIRVQALDSSGLSTSAAVELAPRSSLLRIETQPTGLALVIDEDTRSGPFQLVSLESFHHTVEAQRFAVYQGVPLKFERWSDGVLTPKRGVVMPAQGLLLRAQYRTIGPGETRLALPEQAQWTSGVFGGVTPFDPASPNLLCTFWSASQRSELWYGGPLALPRGTQYEEVVLEAKLMERSGTPRATLAAFAQADPPPFVMGAPGAFSAAGPLRVLARTWDLSQSPIGAIVTSPDLAQLVRPLTGAPSWTAGRRAAFLLVPRNLAGRACFSVSTGAALHVRFAQRPPGPISGQ